MPFSVSIGDIVDAIQLIDKIIHSLRSTNGAASQYQKLERELFAFQRALREIERLQIPDEHKPALDALKCVALGGQHVLKEFMAKLDKYNESLGIGKSVSRVKSLKRKMEWVLPGMEAEVCALRDTISAHREGLSLRLQTLSL